MRRSWMLSAGLWVAVLLGPAPAQEPPHLEFVHGLRARQYPDLALEYLLKLRQRPEYVKDVKLLLETAKTRLELANLEADTGKRLVIFDDARRDLEKFLKENPEHPLRADAELQAASLAALQGKTQLSKALRMDPESAQPDALKARGLLEQAGRRLQEVAARIDGQLAKYSAEDANLPKEQLDEKKSLEHARLEVELGLGVNKYDQAQTFIDRGVNKELEQRTLTVKEGMKFLEKAARRDPKDSLAWEAKAWLGRCLYETGDPRAAEKKLNEVVDEKSKDAEGGQRLARFFLLPIYLEGNRGREDPREVVIREATQWLTDYPRSATTPEGSGVRFQLAKAHAGLGLDAKTVAGPKRDHLAKARMLCKELERSENDFTDRARQLQITLIEREGGFTKPVASLPNFDDCLVRAQFEAYQIHKDAAKAKTPKEADEARKKHFEAIIASLERGLKLNQDAAPRNKGAATEVAQAESMLVGYLLFNGDLDKTVAFGEPHARQKPPTPQQAVIAAYVMQAYAEQLGKKAHASASAEDQAELRAKLWDLAAYVEKTWPQDNAANSARHQMGLQLLREKKYAEAVEALARVGSDYPASLFVKYQLAEAALRAEADKAEPPAGKTFGDIARTSLESIPELPTGADHASTDAFLQARYKLGLLYVNEKKYDEMEKLVDPILARMDKYNLESDTRRDALKANLSLLKEYARLARASNEYNSGHFAQVRTMLDPVVDAVQKGTRPELKQDPKLVRGLLLLDLSANVQDNLIPKALEVLPALKAVPGEAGEEGATVVLRSVAQLVQDQMMAVQSKGKKEEIAKATTGFTALLDELVKQNDTQSPETLRLLAMSYSSLNRHAKALELVSRVSEPKADADDRLVKNFHACQILKARELRLDKQLDKADKTIKDLSATPWGKNNIDLIKEGIHLVEDRGGYAAAFPKWNDLVRNLAQQIAVSPQVKVQYFDCFYQMILCRLKQGQLKKDDKIVNHAGGLLAKLEASWPDFGGDASRTRFQLLLDSEPDLKRHYLEHKQKATR